MKKQKRVAIYCRVSTQDQSTKAQEYELQQFAMNRNWSVTRIYTDKKSGATSSRPALDELMADCRKRKVDVVLTWKVDRLGRSLRHLVAAFEEFKRLGIDFVSMEGIDTTIPSGELVFQIFGAIAQFERTLITERVKAGLAEAIRKGKKIGRPPIRVLTAAEIRKIQAARQRGVTLKKLATQFGASMWAVYQAGRK